MCSLFVRSVAANFADEWCADSDYMALINYVKDWQLSCDMKEA